jgi:hypothetical protein
VSYRHDTACSHSSTQAGTFSKDSGVRHKQPQRTRTRRRFGLQDHLAQPCDLEAALRCTRRRLGNRVFLAAQRAHISLMGIVSWDNHSIPWRVSLKCPWHRRETEQTRQGCARQAQGHFELEDQQVNHVVRHLQVWVVCRFELFRNTEAWGQTSVVASSGLACFLRERSSGWFRLPSFPILPCTQGCSLLQV